MRLNRPLREGISTGACAAAAAKAAALVLSGGSKPASVEVANLQGEMLRVAVADAGLGPGEASEASGAESGLAAGDKTRQAWARVIKDAGDDPDVTNGLPVEVTVAIKDGNRPGGDRPAIIIEGGRGVGRVTKPGLAVPTGEAAINPVPRAMIEMAVREAFEGLAPCRVPLGPEIRVLVEIPGGEEVARKTLNPKLGIMDGISVLGTTGKVMPMSEEAWKNSLPPQIAVAREAGHRILCLTPGRMGERWATEIYGIPATAVVQMSNFVGFMIRACVEQGIEKVILFGHHGKLAKVAAGSWHTHSRMADGRLEVIAAAAALHGAGKELVQALLEANTAEEAHEMLPPQIAGPVYDYIAHRAARRAEEYTAGELEVGCVLLDLSGEILGMDSKAPLMLKNISRS